MKDSSKTEALPASKERGWSERFLLNVIWGWLAVFANLLAGFFVSPFIIRRLGDSRYGIWALAFSFIDYFSLLDFGFKAAAVNRISKYRVQNDPANVNAVVNTTLSYFVLICSLLLVFTLAISGLLPTLFGISPAYRQEFVTLIRFIAFGWAAAMSLTVFSAGLEAFQQFKQQNHFAVLALLFRSGSCIVLLYLGFGLKEMGMAIAASQILLVTMIFLHFRRVFPPLRISPAFVRRSVMKDLMGFGVHSFVTGIGTMLLNQGPPILIGYLRNEAFVGHYVLPARLLQYIVEMVTRIGAVTMPNVAEQFTLGNQQRIIQLAIYLNRYCFALFAPFGIFLTVYGYNLIRVWIRKEFSDQAAVLLLPFVISTAFAVAGQFNSVGILFGMSRHTVYSRALLMESLLSLAGMAVLLPHYGILGAAWISCIFAVLNRGMLTPLLLCRSLNLNWLSYMRSIYQAPLLVALTTAALAWWMKTRWIGGDNWFELAFMLGLLSVQYWLLFFATGVEQQHRQLLLQRVKPMLRGRFLSSSAPEKTP